LRRREFITLFGAMTIAWPLVAQAQQAGKTYRIGFLANDPTISSQPAGAAFVNELRANGFVEGKNILIDWRFAEGRIDRYGSLAAKLVGLQMDLIVASTSLAVIKRRSVPPPIEE
jgi:putative ABC transport system substrate-binding protein